MTKNKLVIEIKENHEDFYENIVGINKQIFNASDNLIEIKINKDCEIYDEFIKNSLNRYGKSKIKKTVHEDRKIFSVERGNECIFESPLNYAGNKSKMFMDIKKNLPENIETFVDAFGGGFNVGINVDANKIVYNDINYIIKNLIESFSKEDTVSYINFIKQKEKEFGLKAKDKDAYQKIRSYYNSSEEKDSKLLYTTVLYGFQQQIRFNKKHEFNNAVGMRYFNDKILEKMISFSEVIKNKNITFMSKSYEDLVDNATPEEFFYFDPPYMLTTGSYNDGKRGFDGWDLNTEDSFMNNIEKLNNKGNKLLISYVLEHKGRKNDKFKKWIHKNNFTLIELEPLKGSKRKEILVKNY